MTAAPRVTILVLAWNGWALTGRTLDSLLATDLGDAAVMVVDNGSTDATSERLADYADRVRILRLPRNTGFVRGNNAGIAAADAGNDIVLLNNDLDLAQHDWLARLRACAHEGANTGIVGCRLVDGEGHLLHAGSVIFADDCRGVQLASGRVERDIGQYRGRDRDVQGVVFAAVYLCRTVIDAIGPLHTDYDTYFEDSDYCLRARAAGFATRLCGGVTLIHRQHGSTTSNDARRHALWSEGQRTFARHWRQSLQERYRQHLVWQSALEFPPRYAAWSRPLLRALDRVDIDVRYAPLYRDLPLPLAESGDSHDHVLNTLRARSAPADTQIVVACGEPALFRHARGRYRIGYADFGDANDIDIAAWNAMDEAWVPSEWHAQSLQEAGSRVPIRVMPRGIDPDYFHPRLNARGRVDGEFTFLLAAAWNEAEQPWSVLRHFSRAFRRDESVRLLAFLDVEGVDLPMALAALDLDPHGGRIVYLLDRHFPDYQRGLVYRAADALVSAPKGAAGDDRMLEAMAVGLPVVAPRHPSRADLMHDEFGWPLAANADPSAWSETLRGVAANPAEAARRGARASDFVLQNRSWDTTAQRIAARCREVEDLASRTPVLRARPPRPRARVIVLGMHRSGTSCVAGLLQAMGLYGGRPDEFLANPGENPYGFFERADLHAFCLTALAQRGGDWSIPLGWSDGDMARELFRAALRPLIETLDTHGGWFIKEPRLCLLFDEVRDLIDTPLVVQVVRDPRAVARSIARRDGLTVPHALALWECYHLAALRARPIVLVDYDVLQRSPADEAARLHAALVAHGAAGLRRLQAAECAAWVRPEFDRASTGAEVPLPAPIERLWRAATKHETLDPIPPLSSHSDQLLRHLFAEHASVLAAARSAP